MIDLVTLADRRFDEWIRELEDDVIQAEYGYEPGEFTIYPDHWRPLFKAGLSPQDAWRRALNDDK